MNTFALSLKGGARVLDAGSGSQPYRRLFGDKIYETADFEQVEKSYANTTYVCDLSSIPVENARYDAVLLSQVLEHLPNPRAVIKEMHRIMKAGAPLFVSAPFYFEEHEKPFDYYRYTYFFFWRIFAEEGFEILSVRWVEGYLGFVSYFFRRLPRHLPWRPSDCGGGIFGILVWATFLILRPLAIGLSWLCATADRRHRYTGRGHPLNYFAIVRKKEVPDEPHSAKS